MGKEKKDVIIGKARADVSIYSKLQTSIQQVFDKNIILRMIWHKRSEQREKYFRLQFALL
jgi:hypothetical protein